MKRSHRDNESYNSDSSDGERPPAKQARKQWLVTGKVPRSTLQRWNKEGNCEEAISYSQDSDSSDGTSNSNHSAQGDGVDDQYEDIQGPGEEGPGDGLHVEGLPGDDDPGSDDPSDDDSGGDDSGGEGSGDHLSDDHEENLNEEEDEVFEDALDFQFLPDPLYEGSRLTCGEAVLKLMTLYSRHAITKSCLKDLVSLIHNDLLPAGNLFPSSYYFLIASIQPFMPAESYVRHSVCSQCGVYIGLFTKGAVLCAICGSTKATMFTEFPLGALIKYMFEKKNLADAIDAYGAGKGSDITRSEEYRRVKEGLHGKYDIQLQWNFDGVQTHKSSSSQLYPIMFSVSEVHPNVRDQFIMIAGLWHAEKKPDANSFLMPLTESLIKLEKEGVTWIHPRTKETYVSKVVAPVVSLDAPARAMAQNLKQHNGEFSCNICEIEGMELRLGPKSRKRVVPFPEEPAPLRTKQSMKEAAMRAEAENVTVKGVKGSTILEAIPECDPASSIVLDYMHLVLLGLCRQFYVLWFTKSGTDWYIGRRWKRITKFFEGIRPTYETTRCPRHAKKWKNFKASTWRTWLLFVSLPALKGILKEKYFQHWTLLVVGIALLLKEDITDYELNLAENLLSLFVRDTQELYGFKAMTYNLHSLLHLPLIVKRWGALWAWSLFKFENTNGILTRLLHGTNKITAELSNTLNLIIATNTLKYLMHPEEYVQALGQFKLLYRRSLREVPDAARQALLDHFEGGPPISIYGRASHGRRIFTSKIYLAEKATDNRTVCYKWEGLQMYGVIQCFVDCNGFYALVQQLSVDEERYFKIDELDLVVNHLIPVKSTDTYVIIELSDISFKVLRVDDYVCVESNHFEQKL